MGSDQSDGSLPRRKHNARTSQQRMNELGLSPTNGPTAPSTPGPPSLHSGRYGGASSPGSALPSHMHLPADSATDVSSVLSAASPPMYRGTPAAFKLREQQLAARERRLAKAEAALRGKEGAPLEPPPRPLEAPVAQRASASSTPCPDPSAHIKLASVESNLASVQKQLANALAELARVQAQSDARLAEGKLARAKAADADRRITTLQQQLDAVSSDLAEVQSQMSEQQARHSAEAATAGHAAAQRQKEQEAALEALQTSLNHAQQAVNTEQAEQGTHKTVATAAELDAAGVRDELAGVRDELAAKVAEADAAAADAAGVRDELAAKVAEADAAAADAAGVRDELAGVRDELAAKVAEADAAADKAAAAEADVAQLQAEVAQLRTVSEDALRSHGDLQSSEAQLREALAAKSAEADAASEQADKLQGNLLNAQADLDDLRDELAAKVAEADAADADAAGVRDELAGVRDELAAKVAEADAAAIGAADLDCKLQDSLADVQDRTCRLKEFETALRDLRAHSAQQSISLGQADQEKSALQQEITDLTHRLHSSAEHLHARKAAEAVLRAQLKDALAANSELQRADEYQTVTIDRLSHQVSVLKARLRHFEDENATLQDSIAANTAQDQRGRLEEELVRVKAEAANSKHARDALAERFSALNSTYQELMSDLQSIKPSGAAPGRNGKQASPAASDGIYSLGLTPDLHSSPHQHHSEGTAPPSLAVSAGVGFSVSKRGAFSVPSQHGGSAPRKVSAAGSSSRAASPPATTHASSRQTPTRESPSRHRAVTKVVLADESTAPAELSEIHSVSDESDTPDHSTISHPMLHAVSPAAAKRPANVTRESDVEASGGSTSARSAADTQRTPGPRVRHGRTTSRSIVQLADEFRSDFSEHLNTGVLTPKVPRVGTQDNDGLDTPDSSSGEEDAAVSNVFEQPYLPLEMLRVMWSLYFRGIVDLRTVTPAKGVSVREFKSMMQQAGVDFLPQGASVTPQSAITAPSRINASADVTVAVLGEELMDGKWGADPGAAVAIRVVGLLKEAADVVTEAWEAEGQAGMSFLLPPSAGVDMMPVHPASLDIIFRGKRSRSAGRATIGVAADAAAVAGDLGMHGMASTSSSRLQFPGFVSALRSLATSVYPGYLTSHRQVAAASPRLHGGVGAASHDSPPSVRNIYGSIATPGPGAATGGAEVDAMDEAAWSPGSAEAASTAALCRLYVTHLLPLALSQGLVQIVEPEEDATAGARRATVSPEMAQGPMGAPPVEMHGPPMRPKSKDGLVLFQEYNIHYRGPISLEHVEGVMAEPLIREVLYANRAPLAAVFRHFSDVQLTSHTNSSGKVVQPAGISQTGVLQFLKAFGVLREMTVLQTQRLYEVCMRNPSAVAASGGGNAAGEADARATARVQCSSVVTKHVYPHYTSSVGNLGAEGTERALTGTGFRRFVTSCALLTSNAFVPLYQMRHASDKNTVRGRYTTTSQLTSAAAGVQFDPRPAVWHPLHVVVLAFLDFLDCNKASSVRDAPTVPRLPDFLTKVAK